MTSFVRATTSPPTIITETSKLSANERMSMFEEPITATSSSTVKPFVCSTHGSG